MTYNSSRYKQLVNYRKATMTKQLQNRIKQATIDEAITKLVVLAKEAGIDTNK